MTNRQPLYINHRITELCQTIAGHLSAYLAACSFVSLATLGMLSLVAYVTLRACEQSSATEQAQET